MNAVMNSLSSNVINTADNKFNFMEKRFVYADNAATTCISEKVLESMMPYLKEQYGNASGIYRKGREAKIAIENAREKIAKAIKCSPNEIYFTSGGTESDNWAITGVIESYKAEGKTHIITSAFEHHAILNTCLNLRKKGFEVTFISPDSDGIINPEDIEKAITEKTALVSIMYANNEIGTIQPIKKIGQICKNKGVIFHTDAVQAFGHINIDINEQNIDMLSISGHKIHSPKGIGALYVRKNINISKFIYGGEQENGKRPGTENVPAIVGLGTATEEALKSLEKKSQKIRNLRDKLISKILEIPETKLNGSHEKRLSGNCNVMIKGVDSESLVLMLDLKGICISGGSACTSGSDEPSHVLLSIGMSNEEAKSSIRFSIDENNSEEDIEYMAKELKNIIEKLRRLSKYK